MTAKIAVNILESPRKRFHAVLAELGHFFRTVLAYCRGLGKMIEQELGQCAVSGTQIQNPDRLGGVEGNGIGEHAKRLDALDLLWVLSFRPFSDVLRRRPIVVIMSMSMLVLTVIVIVGSGWMR